MNLIVISGFSVASVLLGRGGASHLMFDPLDNNLYYNDGSTVYAIDDTIYSRKLTIPVSSVDRPITTIDPSNGNIYVAANSKETAVPVPPDPLYNIIGPSGIILCSQGAIYKIGGNPGSPYYGQLMPSPPDNIPKAIPVGPCPENILFDPDNKKIYTANRN